MDHHALRETFGIRGIPEGNHSATVDLRVWRHDQGPAGIPVSRTRRLTVEYRLSGHWARRVPFLPNRGAERGGTFLCSLCDRDI